MKREKSRALSTHKAGLGSPWGAKKLLEETNRPPLLTTGEKDRPGIVIKHFCKRFTSFYAKAELLDLLEAVITYEGERKVYKGNLVLFYQHLQYLVKLACKMEKHKDYVKQ